MDDVVILVFGLAVELIPAAVLGYAVPSVVPPPRRFGGAVAGEEAEEAAVNGELCIPHAVPVAEV